MRTEFIEYKQGDATLEAYVAYQDTDHKRPAVLISHAWAGRDQFVIDKADAIADLGYVGIAIDMFGKNVLGTSVEENSKLIAPFIDDRAMLRRRINAGLDIVVSHPSVDAGRIGAMGFCFGGLCVLDLARSGADILGVVSFHGLFGAPEKLANETIKAKILALHGYDDPMVPPEQVIALANELTHAKVDWQIHAYGNTSHAFTNPEAHDTKLGTIYNETADQRSWIAMKNFFAELF